MLLKACTTGSYKVLVLETICIKILYTLIHTYQCPIFVSPSALHNETTGTSLTASIQIPFLPFFFFFFSCCCCPFKEKFFLFFDPLGRPVPTGSDHYIRTYRPYVLRTSIHHHFSKLIETKRSVDCRSYAGWPSGSLMTTVSFFFYLSQVSDQFSKRAGRLARFFCYLFLRIKWQGGPQGTYTTQLMTQSYRVISRSVTGLNHEFSIVKNWENLYNIDRNNVHIGTKLLLFASDNHCKLLRILLDK